MNEQKQIEKMALTLSEGGCGNECDCIQGDKFNCHLLHSASVLYRAGYRKQEWISVDERLPEDVYDKDRKIITVLVCTKSGRVSTSSRVRMMMLNKEKRDFEYTDIFEWSGKIAKKITHWMPLPEPPETKGESEL